MSGKLSASDASAWILNVVSCVAIIMVNKELMGARGYGFNFATTLCGLHFVVTGLASKGIKRYLEKMKEGGPGRGSPASPKAEEDKGKRKLPLADLVIFVIVANVSIVSLNTSLMINNVSLYQIAKLGIPPLSAVVERFWFGNRYTMQQMLAMALTLVGVSLVTVAEFAIAGEAIGVLVAAVSVVSSSMQQILCGYYQRKNSLSSNDFLNAVSMWQGITCLGFGPLCDYWFNGKWVTSYELTSGALLFIIVSCLMSVAVNASHFMCLGRFSAVSYQILGHTKTVLVLVCGYYLFGGTVSLKQVFGGTLAIAGMALYGYFTQKIKVVPPSPQPPPALPPSPTSKRLEAL